MMLDLNSKISKERSKKWHDKMVVPKHFQTGDKVLLYDSKLHIFSGKLKSRWIGPFTIHQVYPNGAVELLSSNESQTFKVNGHRLKPYAVPFRPNKEEFTLLEPPPPVAPVAIPAPAAADSAPVPSAIHPSALAQSQDEDKVSPSTTT